MAVITYENQTAPTYNKEINDFVSFVMEPKNVDGEKLEKFGDKFIYEIKDEKLKHYPDEAYFVVVNDDKTVDVVRMDENSMTDVMNMLSDDKAHNRGVELYNNLTWREDPVDSSPVRNTIDLNGSVQGTSKGDYAAKTLGQTIATWDKETKQDLEKTLLLPNKAIDKNGIEYATSNPLNKENDRLIEFVSNDKYYMTVVKSDMLTDDFDVDEHYSNMLDIDLKKDTISKIYTTEVVEMDMLDMVYAHESYVDELRVAVKNDVDFNGGVQYPNDKTVSMAKELQTALDKFNENKLGSKSDKDVEPDY